MEKIEQVERLLFSTFAQLQVLDAVVEALVMTHPDKGALYMQVQTQFSLVRSVAALNAASAGTDPAIVDHINKKADTWLEFLLAQN